MCHLSFYFLFYFVLFLNFVFLKKSVALVIPGNDIVLSTGRWEEINIKIYDRFNPEKLNIIALLRPAGYAHKHNMTLENKQKWLRQMSLPAESSVVVTVKTLSFNDSFFLKKRLRKPGNNIVTGIYIHDTDSVFTWVFKNRNGEIFTVHATKNHPFYVKELNKFLPLSQLTSAMTLTDDHHHAIRLVCPGGIVKNCSTPYHAEKMITVYNIEVNREHRYFVTDQHIMSHNCNMGASNIPGTDISATSISDKGKSSVVHARPPSINTVKTKHLMRGNMLIIGQSLLGNIDAVNPLSQSMYSKLEQVYGKIQYKAIFIRTSSRGLMKYLPGRLPSGVEIYLLMDNKVSGMEYMQSSKYFEFTGVLTPSTAKGIIGKFELGASLMMQHGANYRLVGADSLPFNMPAFQPESLTASAHPSDNIHTGRYFYVLRYLLL